MSRSAAAAAAVFKARVDLHKMRTGSLWRDDMDKVVHAMDQLAHAPTPSTTRPHQPQRNAGQGAPPAASQGRLDLIIVTTCSSCPGEQALRKRTQSVRHLARAQGTAKELKVPVVALSQLSRAPRPGRGPPSSTGGLRESGSIEQDADGAFIFRGRFTNPTSRNWTGC
jgi:replicative DNA helicase